MEINVIAKTVEINDTNNCDTFGESSYILGGRAGGTCYAKEGYFESGIHNSDRAKRIAERTSKSGHHSVFEHSYMTMTITGIPKILAMMLNSTEVYTTSEKSARYTQMEPELKIEKDLYDKWYKLIKESIERIYPNMNIDSSKLAYENARYMTSVFTPTSMIYTVNYRQASYLVYWLQDLVNRINSYIIGNDLGYVPDFYDSIAEYAIELKTKLTSIIGEEWVMEPIKKKNFDFFAALNNKDFNKMKAGTFGNMYSAKYYTSFACLAQLQRHRTIHYEMFLDKHYDLYVPAIVEESALRDEWIKDLEALCSAGVYPQAMMVGVVESGTIDNFEMKMQERLCARAQLEIMDCTRETVLSILDEIGNLDDYSRDKILKWIDTSETHFQRKVKMRCQLNKCLEPCVWGAKHGKTRLI